MDTPGIHLFWVHVPFFNSGFKAILRFPMHYFKIPVLYSVMSPDSFLSGNIWKKLRNSSKTFNGIQTLNII